MRRDPIELEIFKNIYHSIAEEMGAALRRTAFSPNIKERRDYSCAVFDAHGDVIAMGDHMPVHLGSMPMSVRAAIDSFPLQPGRRGDAERSLSRRDAPAGHHAGGAGVCRAQDSESRMPSPQAAGTPAPRKTGLVPISTWRRAPIMPMWAGLIPDRWACAARFTRKDYAFHRCESCARETMERDVLALLLNNVRTPKEREGDLGAQIAACHTGAERLREVCERYGLERAESASRSLAGLLGADDARVLGARATGERIGPKISWTATESATGR